ncbi:MAG: hypothetical protein M1815_004699 [Lichina confinis]|nr:MAG: hypothetical protein M1815_004699 [Lichina confinis]
MAARDRFGTLGGPAQSPLQRYIQSACDPANYEPNLALNLDIAELINSKKGNAPREAAVAIVNYINHRNQNVALLALAVLDICVKNCGYAFHLQISTKEFLNELVRRFPERPPMRPGRVQLRILESIEEWRQTICQSSKYRDDLGYIRDMHRLLSFKGYMFPEIRREDAAVLNPNDNLKSAEEMEEEERSAQSAKLQELIRRGAPQDLQEANKLMKIMAGYDTKHRTDYRAKAAEEVAKVQQKAKILEEMLQGCTKDDKIAEGDLFEELANALQSAQPKIQRMCEEESDDTEAVAKLFEINDSIHRTIERYNFIKKGDFDAASKIPKGTLGTSTGATKTGDNELSLIDLDGDLPQASANGLQKSGAGSEQKIASLEDDLLGLSFQDSSFGQGGNITLSLEQSTTVPIQQQPASAAFLAAAQGSSSQSHQEAPAQGTSSAPSDPFASIAKMPSRHSSPFEYQQQPFGAARPKAPLADEEDDEWTFSTALPERTEHEMRPKTVVLTRSAIQVVFHVSRPNVGDSLCILAVFMNRTPQVIGAITFQVAVTKGMKLQLQPQTGQTLLPNQRSGVEQQMSVQPVPEGSGNSVRIRWKLSYTLDSQLKNEHGEVTNMGIL